jgi:hypothetical protein
MTSTSYHKPLTIDQLLRSIEADDALEEPALDFLEDLRIPLTSHSRRAICLLAWNHGWRPTTSDLIP